VISVDDVEVPLDLMSENRLLSLVTEEAILAFSNHRKCLDRFFAVTTPGLCLGVVVCERFESPTNFILAFA
jgi:hypothetical protein